MKRILGLVAALAGGWVAWSYFLNRGVPKPRYRVSAKKDGYELREYDPYIVAEIDEEGSYKEASNNGFKALFDYISGNNVKQGKIETTPPATEKIAMTAPVVERSAGKDVHTIAFIMPASYTMQTIPRPVNRRIRLLEIPARTVAAKRFSGSPTGHRMEQKMKELLDEIGRDHRSAASTPETARYNPPFTVPFLMRNEILVPVAAKQIETVLNV